MLRNFRLANLIVHNEDHFNLSETGMFLKEAGMVINHHAHAIQNKIKTGIIKGENYMLSKVREVFTKEYREETEYREFLSKMLHDFKLKNKSEGVEEKTKRLSEKNMFQTFV